jgi:hypothetical protein
MNDFFLLDYIEYIMLGFVLAIFAGFTSWSVSAIIRLLYRIITKKH